MSEKTKKVLKIIGIILLVLIALGVYSWIFNGRSATPYRVSKELQRGGGLMGAPDSAMVDAEPMMGMMAEEAAPSSRTANDSVEPIQVADKKIIKNGNLTLKVESTETAAGEITAIAKANEGEVFSTNFRESSSGARSGTVVIKVPVSKFEQTMGELKKVATQVVMESTTGQDVTEQYVDLQAQLKNKRAEEAAFVEILSRSGKIQEVLAVTKEISRVRGQIERLEAQVRYLESQTDMSTITVYVSEDVEISTGDEWRPWQVIKTSVKTLFKKIQGFVDGLIRFVIVTIPTLVIFALVIWFFYWIGKKIYLKLFKKKEEPPMQQ